MPEPDMYVMIIQILMLFSIEKKVTILLKYLYQGYFPKKKCFTLIVKQLTNIYSTNSIACFK